MNRGARFGLISGTILTAVAVLAIVAVVRRGGEDDVSRSRTSRLEESAPAIVQTRLVEGNRWVVSKEDRKAYLSELSEVSKQITLKPTPGKEKGSVTQLTIFKVDADSPMYTAGFRKDDQILKVNGTSVETMGRAINLVHEIGKADDLTLKVKRGDEVVDYRFEFR